MESVRDLPFNDNAFVSAPVPPNAAIPPFCNSEQKQYQGQPTCPFQPFTHFWNVPIANHFVSAPLLPVQFITTSQQQLNFETASITSDLDSYAHEVERIKLNLKEAEDELFRAKANYSFEKKKREPQVLYCDELKQKLKKLEEKVSNIHKTLSHAEVQLNTTQQQLSMFHAVKAQKELMLEQVAALKEQAKANYNEYLTHEVVGLRQEYEKVVQALSDVEQVIKAEEPIKQQRLVMFIEEREKYIKPRFPEVVSVLSKVSDLWANYHHIWSASKVDVTASCDASDSEKCFYDQDNTTEFALLASKFNKANKEMIRVGTELSIREQQLQFIYKHVEKLSFDHQKIKQECAQLNQTIVSLEKSVQAQRVKVSALQDKLKQSSIQYAKDEEVIRNLQEKCIAGATELESFKAQCREKLAVVNKLRADVSLVEHMKF
ncbi:hypothetical protein JQC92_14515 [Shewanella sp. 202IG2-18]|uniref:hypothetical protein n=1 Tax=Parashewanella hymeniacidonis TaxID=2807618 RepID=UPI0019601D67|nr:hypothetical protein [Parashewanella hymeniacidonis]MBM7073226.1 hypothetical protein [Parashewanella hymeniacidonis]